MSQYCNYQELPLVDREQFEMLVYDGDEASSELIDELLQLFEADSIEILDGLRLSWEKGDWGQVKRQSHSIAGSSANIGGKRLWGLCKYIEELAENGGLSVSSPQYAEVLALYGETLEALRNEIAKI